MTDPGPHYRPGSADLLRTVSEFLAAIGPTLEAGDRYSALVCTHILAMLERELSSPELPHIDEAGLAAAIRSGACDDAAKWEKITQTILLRTIARVQLVKPDHLEKQGSKEGLLF